MVETSLHRSQTSSSQKVARYRSIQTRYHLLLHDLRHLYLTEAQQDIVGLPERRCCRLLLRDRPSVSCNLEVPSLLSAVVVPSFGHDRKSYCRELAVDFIARDFHKRPCSQQHLHFQFEERSVIVSGAPESSRIAVSTSRVSFVHKVFTLLKQDK